VFDTIKLFLPSLIFKGKFIGLTVGQLGMALAILANIRLGLPRTNSLAYFSVASVMKKSLIALSPVENDT